MDAEDSGEIHPAPMAPATSPSDPTSTALSRKSQITHNPNCPFQIYDCSRSSQNGAFGQKTFVLSEVLDIPLYPDILRSVDMQLYPQLEHHISVAATSKYPFTPEEEDGAHIAWYPLPSQTLIDPSTCQGVRGDIGATNTTSHHESYMRCLCDLPCRDQGHFQQLHDLVHASAPGWIIYLRDNRLFSSRTSVAEIMAHVDHPDQLLLFRSLDSPLTRSSEVFGRKRFETADLDSSNFAFHSSHLSSVRWDSRSCGGWRIFEKLSRRLQMKWIDPLPVMKHPLAHDLELNNLDLPITAVITADCRTQRSAWLFRLLDHYSGQWAKIDHIIVLWCYDRTPPDFRPGGVRDPQVTFLRVMPNDGLAEGLILVRPLIRTVGVLLTAASVLLDEVSTARSILAACPKFPPLTPLLTACPELHALLLERVP